MQGFVVPDSDRIPVAPQASGGPRLRQVVPPAPAKPRLPPMQTPAQAEADTLDVDLKRLDLAEKRKKAATAPGADPNDAVFEIANVIEKAKTARRKSNEWFATGFGSGMARKFGGTNAADVQSLLDTVGANTAFERLQKMRDSSPTGGALGNITERELDLLKSTIASLSPDQSDQQFQNSMRDIIRSYGRVLMKLPGGADAARRRGWLGNEGQPAPQAKQKAGGVKFLGFEGE